MDADIEKRLSDIHSLKNVRIIPGGALNHVLRCEYAGVDAIAKVYNQVYRKSEQRFDTELGILKEGRGFPYPVLLDYSARGKWIIYEFIKGETLKNYKPGNNVDIASLVNSLTKIHDADYSPSQEKEETYYSNLLASLETELARSGLPPEEYQSVKGAISHLRGQKNDVIGTGGGRVHGDLNAGNILLDAEGRVNGIIDWEFTHIGNVYSDLAQLCNLEDDRSTAITSSYFGDSFDGELFDFFKIYFLTKLILNNSPNNIKDMVHVSDDKRKIIRSKKTTLMERF